MKVYLFDILIGRVYKKLPKATYTYIYCTSVKDYLLNLLGNIDVADLIAPHVTQLTTLLLNSACRLIKPIKIDYNFKEGEDEYLFDVAGKRFIKESGSLEGPPRAFIRYEYTESGKPNLALFIEVTHFHFVVFLDSTQLISKLKEGPKGFYLQLSSYCQDLNLYHTLSRLISYFLTPCHPLSHLTPYVGNKTNLSPRLEAKPTLLGNFQINSQDPIFLSYLITPSHSLSHFVKLYPLAWKETIFNWQP